MTARVIQGALPQASTPPDPPASSLVSHWDAANVTRTGSLVTAWPDDEGNNNLDVVNGDPQYYATAANGLPAIVCDGNGDSIEKVVGAGLPSGNENRTLIAVVKYVSGDYAGMGYGTENPNGSYMLCTYPNNELTVLGGGGENDFNSGESVGTGEWLIHTAVHNNGTTTQYRNITQTSPGGTFAHTYETGTDEIIIGREIGFTNYINLELAEFSIYSEALINSELNTILNSLMTKYGIGIGDSTPDAFSFVDENDVPTATLKTSAAIQVTGITISSPITVTGTAADPKYSINGGPATADAGNVVNGDSVQAVHTSSASNSTAVTTVITIGGVADTYTTTTQAAGEDTEPDPIAGLFNDITGATVSTQYTSNAVTLLGFNATTAVTIGGTAASPQWEKNDSGTWNTGAGTADLNDTIKVRVDSSASYSTTLTAVLTLDGTVSDTYSVQTGSDPGTLVDITRDFNSGTLGQTSEGADGYSSLAGNGEYSNEQTSPKGGQCSKNTIYFGQGGQNGTWPGQINTPDVPIGYTLYIEFYEYLPTGWDWSNNQNGETKWIGINDKYADGSNNGRMWMNIRGVGNGFRLIKEGFINATQQLGYSRSTALGGPGAWTSFGYTDHFHYDAWTRHNYEVHLHNIPLIDGGQAYIKYWNNTNLVAYDPSIRTLNAADHYVTHVQLHNYWNQGPKQTQFLYMDNIVITTAQPGDWSDLEGIS